MKRQKSRTLALLLMAMGCVLQVMAQKPKWVGNTPHELNATYRMVEVVSEGTTLEAARLDARQKLAQDEDLMRAIEVNIETGLVSKEGETITNGRSKSHYEDEAIVKMNTRGETYRLQAKVVDEYNAGHRGGLLRLHTLFMVAVQDNPKFDRAYLSTNYGVAPVLMSIIPGVGQMYKGSTAKGLCMLGAEAACVVGVILCENQRADYSNKMKEQPQFAATYSNKKKNWETGRNICIGAAASVWIWNIVDAAVAKGGRKVTLKPGSGRSLSVTPMATPTAAGLSIAYNF